MQNKNRRTKRAAMALTALLAGGSVLESCQTQWRDAFFNGTSDFALSLLDPAAVLDLIQNQQDNGS